MKSAVSSGFGHINWRNPWWKTWYFAVYGVAKAIKDKITKNIEVSFKNFHWDIRVLIGIFTFSFKIYFSIFYWSNSIKLKLFLSFTFALNCNNSEVVSILKNCFQSCIITITYQKFIVWISWDIKVLYYIGKKVI